MEQITRRALRMMRRDPEIRRHVRALLFELLDRGLDAELRTEAGDDERCFDCRIGGEVEGLGYEIILCPKHSTAPPLPPPPLPPRKFGENRG